MVLKTNKTDKIVMDIMGKISSFERKNLSALIIIGFIAVMLAGYGASAVSGTPDVSIGQNGIQINSGGLDMGGGNITDGGTTIYDASKGYISSSVVETAGLDADTLDGYNTSQLTWNVLGIAQSDVSASDVGLGNVENENALAQNGSEAMKGNLDITGYNLQAKNGNTATLNLRSNGDTVLTTDDDSSSGGSYKWTISGSNGNLKANNKDIVNLATLETNTIEQFSYPGNNIELLGNGADIVANAKQGNSSRFIVSANGDVKLIADSNGDQGGTSTCTLDATDGSWDCQGTKAWIQSLNSTHEAVYTSQESAMVRAVYEGQTTFSGGKVNISLPHHYEDTVSEKKPMLRVQATPHSLTTVAVTARDDSWFVIKADTQKEITVDYRITGIREGYEDKQVVRKKSKE